MDMLGPLGSCPHGPMSVDEKQPLRTRLPLTFLCTQGYTHTDARCGGVSGKERKFMQLYAERDMLDPRRHLPGADYGPARQPPPSRRGAHPHRR
jgi:hypothetical protein